MKTHSAFALLLIGFWGALPAAPPVFESVTASPSATVSGTTVQLLTEVSDPDGEAVEVSWSVALAPGCFPPEIGEGASPNVTFDAAGAYVFRARAEDASRERSYYDLAVTVLQEGRLLITGEGEDSPFREMTPFSPNAPPLFDGQEHTIVYVTNSHGGQRQLAELAQLVPGGENISVYKAIHRWAEDQEAVDFISQVPIMVRRYGTHRSAHWDLRDIQGPESTEAINANVAIMNEVIFENLNHEIGFEEYIGISGFYNERKGREAAQEVLAASQLVVRAFNEQNTDCRVSFLDTHSRTEPYYPFTIASDLFHSSDLADYIESREILRQLCHSRGIMLPLAVDERVDLRIDEAIEAETQIEIFSPVDIFYTDLDVYLGDSVTVKWDVAEGSDVSAVYVMMHRVGGYDFYLSNRIEITDPEWGELTWIVQDNLPSVRNKVKDIPLYTMETAPVQAFQNEVPGGWDGFAFRIVNADDPTVFTFSGSFAIKYKDPPRDVPQSFFD